MHIRISALNLFFSYWHKIWVDNSRNKQVDNDYTRRYYLMNTRYP